MKLFAKGKGEARSAKPSAPAFTAIDRTGLLGLLDQVVNGGQTGVIQLREARGEWTYAFQGGALIHASGGRVRGARQAFDLLWEFGTGEVMFTPGSNPALAGNLYIDKSRLLDLLRRSQAVLQGPAAPYIPPDQQRPIPQGPPRFAPPNPGQMPQPWQPPAGVQGQPPGPQWPQPAPQPPMPGWNPAAAGPPPGYPPPYPPPYPVQMPGAYPPGYPQAGQPIQPPYPPMQAAPPPAPTQPVAPVQPASPVQPAAPVQQVPPAAAPMRPVTPPSFSVPPMAIPKKKEPTYQPPVAAVPAPATPAPEPPVAEPAKAGAPKDDLQALRASLVAQAPPVRPGPSAPNWGVRTAGGTVAPPPVNAKGKGKGTTKAKGKSKLRQALEVQLIKFLLWACERKYSADDHWTLKDAFEVSTMELRDQFFGAFSQSFQSSGKSKRADEDEDDMAAGRMRGRGRRH